MHIPYSYLAVLLVFTLLIGVVIGDQLSASPAREEIGRSGGCSGLASARLHACVHRLGSWRPPSKRPSSGTSGPAGCPDCWRQARDTTCEIEGNGRED
jgi:hypothetical protein